MAALTAARWDSEWTGEEGVYVFGTHDTALATPVAQQACLVEYGTSAVIADRTGHWRLDDPGDTTDPRWVEDPVNGEPAVQFTAIHDDSEDGVS